MSSAALFAGVVRGFEVCADLFECEPGWLELTARVERRLVHVVLALRISAGAEGVNRQGADLWSKLNHADVGSTGDSVAPFLPALGRSVKREYRAVVTIHSANSEAPFGIVKIFVTRLIDTLQAVEL